MEELRALKNEYHAIVDDLRKNPYHIYMYDLETINNELYIKKVQYITGCTTIEVKKLELLPKIVLRQIHKFLKGVLYRNKQR